MITYLEVDGFKTLTNFRLDFRPGLNILVGPNGSGKTNIVSFFEFLSHLMETNASEATSRVGGAGAIFRRVDRSYETHIKSKIVGSTTFPQSSGNKEPGGAKRGRYLHYEYKFTLLFPESRDSVVFESQQLRLGRSRSKNALRDEDWGIDIESTLSPDGEPVAQVLRFDPALVDARFLGIHEKTSVESIASLFTSMLSTNISVVNVLTRYSPSFWSMVRDVSTGQVYNIVPSRVKLPEDSAKPAGIARDGSGLAATLYAMQMSREPERFNPWSFSRQRMKNFSSSALDELRKYLQLVNTSIEDILVENDTFDNQLRVRFRLKSGDYTAEVPMALMSDGILKWVALITAALTSSTVFSIEEPENYLHPHMQELIVMILREILFNDDKDRFTILTTHSETLLNHCLPTELVIVSIVDGKTVALRCDNVAQISKEIDRTGFGLGYYYTKDALN